MSRVGVLTLMLVLMLRSQDLRVAPQRDADHAARCQTQAAFSAIEVSKGTVTRNSAVEARAAACARSFAAATAPTRSLLLTRALCPCPRRAGCRSGDCGGSTVLEWPLVISFHAAKLTNHIKGDVVRWGVCSSDGDSSDNSSDAGAVSGGDSPHRAT